LQGWSGLVGGKLVMIRQMLEGTGVLSFIYALCDLDSNGGGWLLVW
jgi:hypothetical protein